MAVLGLSFALAANRVSPRGLTLTKNYFPSTMGAGAPRANSRGPELAGTATNQLTARRTQLRARGFQPLESSQAIALFHDLRVEQELVVFVDARDDRHYQAGHIPGAFQLDPYHAELYLPTLLPVCQTAEQIVIYCNGGDCEDSESAALVLTAAGVSATNLFIYTGGWSEWATNGQPRELGGRKSGDVRRETP